MLKFIRVNKIAYHYRYGDEDVVDSSAPEETSSVTINPTAIKSYYARKNGRVGTRINFLLGNGFAISEPVEEFEALLAQAGVEVVGIRVTPGTIVNVNDVN